MRRLFTLVVGLTLTLALFLMLPVRPASANVTRGTYTPCGWGQSCVLGIHAGGTDQVWGRFWHETYNPYNGTYSYWPEGWNGSYTCGGFSACYNEYRSYPTGWNDHLYYAEVSSVNGTGTFGYVGP